MSTQGARSRGAAVGVADATGWVTLDAGRRCDEACAFEQALFRHVVAQDGAVLALSQLYQVYLARLTMPGKPIGALLFLGPTGSGKTHSVEAAAGVLFNDSRAIVKIDCAEFQHSHEIAKLIGSPPGYLGHRETSPLLTQENLDRFHTRKDQLTFLLFDEIEKASDALWQLLLGVLDKATLTLGDNRRVDFSNCVVVLTSNLGAREMSEVTEGRLGFTLRAEPAAELDGRLERIAVEAARRKFSPEFINRLDKLVVFRSLREEALGRILDLEIEGVEHRIMASGRGKFLLCCTARAKDFLLAKGYDRRYGARPLKRAIERYLVMPLSNLVATGQVLSGDVVHIDHGEAGHELCFSKATGNSLVAAGARRARMSST
ncbi:MAG TPA: AAA family ATPase [Blastocatellia bacterium]|nr:AAA family ATPase [Blastocatellia bacterium]